MPTIAYVNRIATAVPPHEAHAAFLGWANARLSGRRDRALFGRMASRSGIERRWSVLPHTVDGGDPNVLSGFYSGSELPPTSARMEIYAQEAPKLALRAIAALGPLDGITHLVVASCTGFVAPGIDQIIARALKLDAGVERTLIGFMGCYAAVSALRIAHHLVRSEPAARVLVVTVELSTLHLQPDIELEPILAMMLFGDGAAAAIVTADAEGFALAAPFAVALTDSEDMIRWAIGDSGFAMHLSGAVPARIAQAFVDPAFVARVGDTSDIDCWAVHAGGRTILDAVEQGFRLNGHALDASRDVLRSHGNMSSATLMFVLKDLLASDRRAENGFAIAFGPGLAAEGFRFRRVA